jgi:hypothetical protein
VILWTFPSVFLVQSVGRGRYTRRVTLPQVVGARGVWMRELAVVVAVGNGDGRSCCCRRLSSDVQHAKTHNTELQLRPKSRPRCIETCRNLKISSSMARYRSVLTGMAMS